MRSNQLFDTEFDEDEVAVICSHCEENPVTFDPSFRRPDDMCETCYEADELVLHDEFGDEVHNPFLKYERGEGEY